MMRKLLTAGDNEKKVMKVIEWREAPRARSDKFSSRWSSIEIPGWTNRLAHTRGTSAVEKRLEVTFIQPSLFFSRKEAPLPPPWLGRTNLVPGPDHVPSTWMEMAQVPGRSRSSLGATVRAGQGGRERGSEGARERGKKDASPSFARGVNALCTSWDAGLPGFPASRLSIFTI
jgi:hypothetical protein